MKIYLPSCKSARDKPPGKIIFAFLGCEMKNTPEWMVLYRTDNLLHIFGILERANMSSVTHGVFY